MKVKDTRIDLVKALQEAKVKNPEKASKIDLIKSMAYKGYYHNYESPLPFPKIQLEQDLQELGLEELVSEVVLGEYDEMEVLSGDSIIQRDELAG